MLNASRVRWAWLVLTVLACSTKNQDASDDTSGQPTGGAAYVHTGGAGNAAGNGSNVGGAVVLGTAGGGATAGKGTGGTRAPTGGAGTGGSSVCGTSLCNTIQNSCGKTVNACGNTVDCGFTNCDQTRCGLSSPNQCLPCAKIDCISAGNKNCGPVSDGCGGLLDCGTCDTDSCCGCGSPGTPNVCGKKSTAPPSVSSTCIVGSKGCLCDTNSGCAPGNTCDTTKSPPVCCAGSDCAIPANRQIGGTCTGTGTANSCTPGITIPSASGSNDNCGYPASSFNESQFMCGIFATGGGSDPARNSSVHQ